MLQAPSRVTAPAWLDDLDPTLPKMPGWLLDSPGSEEALEPAGCPCCVEPAPVPVASVPVRWDVPGQRFGDAPAPAPLPPVSPAVAELQALLARVTDTVPASLPESQALVDLQALLQVGQGLRVHTLSRLADAQTRQLHTLTAARSTRGWLDQVAPDRPVVDLPLARKLTGLPVLRDRVRAGALSLTAAGKVAAALGKARPELDQPDGLIDGQPATELVPAVVREVLALVAQSRLGMSDTDPVLLALSAALEQVLVDGGSQLGQLERAFVLLAEHLPTRWLREALQRLLDALLPNELERRAARDEGLLSLTDCGSGLGWDLRGHLDDETGELFHVALTAAARGDDQNAQDTADAAALRAQGLDPSDPSEPLGSLTLLDASVVPTRPPRSRPRRWHDALTRLLHRYLAADLAGTSHKAPVRISVTVSSALLDNTPGAPPALGGSGKALPRSLVRRWWCDATVTPFLLSHGWQALGTLHTTRTLTATERVALDLQSGGHRCAGLHCCRNDPNPLTGLEPHHVTPWATTGTTSLRDTIWACPVLHHDLHHGRTATLRNGRHLTQHGWTSGPGAT
jgi:hypothetical protein